MSDSWMCCLAGTLSFLEFPDHQVFIETQAAQHMDGCAHFTKFPDHWVSLSFLASEFQWETYLQMVVLAQSANREWHKSLTGEGALCIWPAVHSMRHHHQCHHRHHHHHRRRRRQKCYHLIWSKTVTMKMSRFARITPNHSWRRKDNDDDQNKVNNIDDNDDNEELTIESSALLASKSHGVTNRNRETKKTSEVTTLMTLVCRETWSNLDISQVATGYNDNDETK